MSYLDRFKILCDNQYGFRKNHSTLFALIDLYDKISSAIDRKEISVGIFLDLSKAFDTVNHKIIFEKLEYYGIRGLPLQWIKNYFRNRFQFVQYNEYYSSRKKVCCGVPQGSILGPLFFLLYTDSGFFHSGFSHSIPRFRIPCFTDSPILSVSVNERQ